MDNPNAQTAEGNQEIQQQQTQTATQQATQEGTQQERLYAGRYKTPDELENAYKFSSQEGIRLAQEVQRLNGLLQQAQTPQQREAIQDKIDDLNKYFDPETAKIISGYVDRKVEKRVTEALDNYRQQTKSQSDFENQVTDVWNETKKIYPDVANPNSPLYRRANEILFERGLAEMNNGILHLLTPFAYRIAVEAAAEESSRQAPANAELQTKKTQATAIQGKGSKSAPQGKLTYEQYKQLPDEDKDAYDQSMRQ